MSFALDTEAIAAARRALRLRPVRELASISVAALREESVAATNSARLIKPSSGWGSRGDRRPESVVCQVA
jgi:hypothetical protein